jgi:hypothetical protein
VRATLLPVIIQQQYNAAKTAFGKKDFATAVSTFTQMLVMSVAGRAYTTGIRTRILSLRN